ncbi:MAG: Tat pathway signal protein [Bacteroidetes bacterium]|nr:Tat pathway signal protein [Bacteroidota bacterium]
MNNKATIYLLAILFFACANDSQIQESDNSFFDSLTHRTFNFFWDNADSLTGNQPDRWPTKSFSSIAATGFGLTSYLVGVNRGYISREQAGQRVLKTLKFFQNSSKGSEASGVTGYKGFFYHFIDMRTGQRFQQVELSTIDTGLLMAGILSCQSFFDQNDKVENEIRDLADSLFLAVEWDWAMNEKNTLSMGWHPEKGFLDASWRGYNEGMILYVMGLGSPTHPMPQGSWEAWTKTYQWGNYFGQEHINFGPLFGHQYSHMFIDFKGIQDEYTRLKGIDYFENSRRATLANRQYCISNPADWIGYDKNVWGLTACDGPGNDNNSNPNVSFDGYTARGASQWYVNDDGTIAPTAAGGSVPFVPEFCLPALEAMHKKYGDRIYGKYGFFDSFNLSIIQKDGTSGWVDKDYLGIDQGPILIQLENHRNHFVWDLMKKNKYIVEGLKKAGFSGGWLK